MKTNELRKMAGIAHKDGDMTDVSEETSEIVTESNEYPMGDIHEMYRMHGMMNEMIVLNMNQMKHGHDDVKEFSKKMDMSLVEMRDECFAFCKTFETKLKNESK